MDPCSKYSRFGRKRLLSACESDSRAEEIGIAIVKINIYDSKSPCGIFVYVSL